MTIESEPTPKTDASDTAAELKLLRYQVDILQIATAEKKKPWYKQASIIVSVMALLFSFASATYMQIGKNAEETRSQKDELRKILTLVLDLRGDYQNRIGPIQNAEIKEEAGTYLNAKRMIYLQAAELLVAKIPQHVSTSEYHVLAWEAIYDSNFKQAKKYLDDSLNASRDTLSKLLALRSLASFYFIQGPLKDPAKARKLFQQIEDELTNITPLDDYSLYIQGQTYQYWGFGELANNFQAEGAQKIEMARKHYLDMSLSNPLRSHSLEVLDIYMNRTPGKIPDPESILYGKPSKH